MLDIITWILNRQHKVNMSKAQNFINSSISQWLLFLQILPTFIQLLGPKIFKSFSIFLFSSCLTSKSSLLALLSKFIMNLTSYHCFYYPPNGTPLQYSCLENPMDGGAWKAAVHEVAKSWTRLSIFTLTFHFHALEKEMATHSSVLAWRIPGMGEPGGLLSMGLHRVGHD